MKLNLVQSLKLPYHLKKKRKRSTINPQQVLNTLVRNATFAMFQDKNKAQVSQLRS